MTYTLRDLILDAMKWAIAHPKALFPITTPITKAKVRTKYNAENSPADFDAFIRDYIREHDAQYIAYSDSELDGMILAAVSDDEDLTNELSGVPSGGD